MPMNYLKHIFYLQMQIAASKYSKEAQEKKTRKAVEAAQLGGYIYGLK